MSRMRWILTSIVLAVLASMIAIGVCAEPSVQQPELRGDVAGTHTHSLTSANVPKSFEEKQLISTSGAVDWEFFTIGQDAYLALANSRNDSTYNVNSKIYQWNGTNFAEFQSIPTSAASDWEFFTIGEDAYLAMANHYNGSTHNIDSKIYRWNGTNFIDFQSIPTSGAADWEFFTIEEDAYLALANRLNGSTCNIDSKIYKWNGATFAEIQSIPTHCATGWEAFTIEEETYLAVANSNNDSTDRINSKIYKWNGSRFAETQSIPTQSAWGWESFAIDDDLYLVVANLRAEWGAWNIDSEVYKWDGSDFVEFQSIPTSGACDWEFFTAGEDAYLAVANGRWSVSNFSPDSKVYRWNGTGFAETRFIPTDSAHDWEAFVIGSDLYLAVANYRNDSTWMRDSVIYKAVLASGEYVVYLPIILNGLP